MSEKAELHRRQLAVNIDTIVEYLWKVPGVTAVDIEEPQADAMWEKKVFVIFAGCDEPVGIELY